MGMLIVVGVIVLAMVIAQRLSGATKVGIGERTVSLPEGGRVIGAAPGDGKLAVTIAMPDGSTRIELFDLSSGKSVGAIAIPPAAPR